MLRLLHTIRRKLLANNELGKYFWYAIGEILLVVTGILIALQINNWNEERVEQKQIKEYALALVGDVQRDMEMLAPVDSQIRHLIDRADQLAAYTQGKTLADIRNIDLFIFTRSPSYRPFAWNRAAFEQLKSSGAMRHIRNQQLVNKISQYDALTRHLDQDYTNDENNIREAVNIVSRVVDTNYPQYGAIEEYLDRHPGDIQEVFSRTFAEFTGSDLYREIRDNDLPLLADDLYQVRRAVNYYLEIGRYLGARTDIELPRLKQYGLEIIELIDAEYK